LIENEVERKAFLAEFDESSMIVNKKKLTDDDENDLTALLNQKIQTVKNQLDEFKTNLQEFTVMCD